MSEVNQKAGKPGSRLTQAILWVAVGLLAVVIAFLLFKPANTGGGIRKVDSAGLITAQQKGAQVVDVRTSGEFALGHIQGAINVPVDQLQAAASSWDRNASYVVYCASGERSAQAQQIMQSMGFKNVADLTGGVGSWTGQLVKGSAAAEQKIQTSGKPVFIEFYTPT